MNVQRSTTKRRNNELSNNYRTQIISNKHADAVLDNQASYAHALSPEKV